MKMKKLLSAALCAAMILSAAALPVNASAETVIEECSRASSHTEDTTGIVKAGYCGDSVEWALYNSGVVYIFGSGDMYDYSYNSSLPWKDASAVVVEEGVTGIGAEAFYNCQSLKTAKLADSVTHIETDAFYCSGLTDIEIPSSVSYVGSLAFAATPWYNNYSGQFLVVGDGVLVRFVAETETAAVPSNVKTLAPGCLYGTRNLTSVTLPDSVVSIGDNVFSGCSKLTEIKLSSKLESIGRRAFESCSSLASIDLPDSLKSIGDYAFYNCTNLSQINIPTSVTYIGLDTFTENAWLKNKTVDFVIVGDKILIGYNGTNPDVVIPDSVKNVAPGTFSKTTVRSVVFPNGVTTIETDMFEKCKELTKVYIPKSVTTIKPLAFLDCSALKDVYYEGTQEEWNNIQIDYTNLSLNSVSVHYEALGFDDTDKPKTDKKIIGDINADGKVTAADSMLIQRFTIKMTVFDETQTAKADVNSDGKVTAADAIQILRYTIGMKASPDIGKELTD